MCRANFVYTTIVSDSIKRCPLIRSWSLSSSFHVMVLMTFGILIGTVAGRPTAYKRTHADAFRGNLSNDVNAINAYVRNQAAPKVCSFLLDAETADRLSLDGRITVVIRFSSEMLVMRQVIMFNKLESRFRKGGFLNTQFVVVYADGSEATAANATQSRPHTTTSTSGADTTTTGDETSDSDDDAADAHDMIERIPTVYNVTVLKENHPVGGSASRDAAHRSPFAAFEQQACYVFDTCGRLAYIIYYPWSSIHRPFVKAAILSSHFDHPCGKCETASSLPPTTTEMIPSSTTLSDESSSSSNTPSANEQMSIDPVSRMHSTGSSSTTSATKRRANLIRIDHKSTRNATTDESYRIPIQIVVPGEHAHLEVHQQADDDEFLMRTEHNATDDQVYIKFKFMVLRTGDPEFHEHLPTDQPEKLTRVSSSEITDSDISSNATDVNESTATAAIVLSNEYGNRFVGTPVALPVNASEPQPIQTTFTTQLNRIHYTKEFINLQAVNEFQSLSNASEMDAVWLGMAWAESANEPDPDENTVYNLYEEQRTSNEHYGQILQWIQFVL